MKNSKAITQQELGKLLGVSSSEVHRIVSGNLERGYKPKKAEELSERSGVGWKMWLRFKPEEMRRELERSLGVRINQGRGRPQNVSNRRFIGRKGKNKEGGK